ncbi:hypothetical protein HYFRA_00001891 [Hymenoscyphus fraxineus]|uniref:Uncharacterized protein n=1 Tax=Hymenoscyphus fraxineus TaxID=746836 RepID=A0A9N9PE74_9HELO|nr:hypothetical protein HYFRA_00001891 [Hymenoscyphus fraxineus]
MLGPQACTRFGRLPEEILRYVLLDIDSIPSLYKLMQAVPTVVHSCIAIFDELIGRILRRSIDEELRCYLYAIVQAQAVGHMSAYELGFFLDTHFEISNPNKIPEEIPRSLRTIEYMAKVLAAVDHFSTLCPEIWSWCGCVGLFSNPILPLTMWKNKYQIRRALFRFQLYCELFHKPGQDIPDRPYAHTYSHWGWEENWDAQELFWLRYEAWEIEECKSIYYTLIFHLEYVTKNKDHLLSCCIRNRSPHSKTNIRGLPTIAASLNTTCVASLPPFQQAYLEILLQRPFSGFRITDPDDLGYFSHRIPNMFHDPIPQADYRTSRRRRWAPSPFPGVTLRQLCLATS